MPRVLIRYASVRSGIPSFFAAVRPFLSEIREMRHYVVTSIAARKP